MLHRPERNVASDQIPPAPILKAPEDPTADPRGRRPVHSLAAGLIGGRLSADASP